MINFAIVKRWVIQAVTSELTLANQDVTTTGTVTGGDLVATDDLTVGDAATITGACTLTAQTAGRVLYSGTAGLVSSEAALAYNAGTDTLTVPNLTVGTSATVTALTATIGANGVTPISAPTGLCNWQPIAATSGTDTTPADGTQFVTSIWIPCNMTITNINYLIGSVGGTNVVYGVLYDSTGAVLRNTAITSGGATVGTAANIQTLALTSTYAAKGPGRFFVGISINGNTARLRTVPAHCQAGLFAGSVSQTHGTSPTVAAITPPSTFTADKAPLVFLS